ncbi:MAG: SPOR domain-containing protein [Acidovorax sp.]|uniref:SPOR domain-containing protein n=1 Tax=Acidovorax sp. TaxID=1872122 RepID=UPI0025BAF096|nr:SPOR domain-containing protein [Acidovorax sp.]MCE1192997.1 SPOR domain-containing protein [Acidovorax sp.]
MAFFKFRWPGQSEQPQAEKPAKRPRSPQGESIEVMRRRARHRLIGAAVLVLLGVIGFPMLFDTQPRPVPVDIPIEIPDRNKVAPLVVPAPVAEAPASAKPATPEPSQVGATAPRSTSAVAANGLSDGEELVPSQRPAASRPAAQAPSRPEAKPEAKPEPKPERKPESKPEHKPESKPEAKPEHKPETKPETKPAPAEPKPAPRTDEAARARALLEGRSTEPAAASAQGEEGRFIVQVGAFADADKAREARTKVERAGLKTYTQVADTKDGKRTRVRVGPFNNRAEADKAAARIKGLGLSASVLTL